MLSAPASLSDRKAWPNTASHSDSHLRPGMRRTPAHSSSPTGTIRADWDQPTRDARSVRTRKWTEKVRQGAQVKPQYWGQYPIHLQKQYSATSLAQQSPNSVVGADIFPCSIVGAINSLTVRLPPHASRHRQCCGRRHLPYRANMVRPLTCL